MRLLMVNIWLQAQHGGGTAERTRHLALSLARLGARCTLVTGEGRSWQQEFDASHIPVIVTGLLGRRLPHPFLPWRALWRAVRAADIIHVMGYWNLLTVLMVVLSRLAGRPYVLCPAGEFAFLGRGCHRVIFHHLLGRWMLRGAAGFIAITPPERELIARVTGRGDMTLTCPNGVSPEVRQGSEALPCLPDEPFILFMGRLASVKGPDLLLQAYAACDVARRFPLVLAGQDCGLLKGLQRYADSQGLAERVHFVGHLTEAQHIQAYGRAIMLVIPSRSEAMSLVVLEAGKEAVPVLLTTTCGFDDVAQVGGGLVVQPDVPSLAAGLERMLGQPEALPQQGERLRAHVMRHYGWSEVSARLLADLRRLTGSRPGR